MLLLLWAIVAESNAQRAITGRVTETNGEPLAGATVRVKGAAIGTSTDLEGNFRLDLPAGARWLTVSYTGYTSKEFEAGTSNTLNIVLDAGATGLDEVVVTGYGTQQRRDITGTVSSIKGSEVANQAVQSFDQALQGRAAGVNINLPNGVLNNPPVIRVRGINSINLSSFPLIVIDGVPGFSVADGVSFVNSAAQNPLSNLNPNDIESIEILKDASATAIYGSRASAGVLLITTKRGKKGKAKVSYDAWAGWTQVACRFDLLDARQYVAYKNEAARNAGFAAPQFFLDSLNGQLIDTDWYDEVLQTGFSHSHNLSFSGGSDHTTYFLAAGYTNQNGMLKRNEFERRSIRFNLDHRVGERLKMGVSASYAGNLSAAPNTGSINGTAFNLAGLGRIPLISAPIVAPMKADGSYNINPTTNELGRGKNLQRVGFVNPRTLLDLDKFTSGSTQIQGSVYAQIDLWKGLAYRTQYGIDQLALDIFSFQSPLHGDGASVGGLAGRANVLLNRWNWQHTVNYDVALGEKNKLSVLVGNEQQRTLQEGWGANRTQTADPFFTTFQGNFSTINPSGANFQGENYLLSYFGRLNYDFAKKYLISANVRQDEFSAFAPGQKRGFFWGVSAGWSLSEEIFFKEKLGDVVNYLRLRGSYGQVGNNQGISDFASQSLFNSGLHGTQPTFFFTQAGNPNLSWETSNKTDLGINFGLLGDKITGEITYFINDIDGLILNTPQSSSKGIPGASIQANIGSMRNRGWEFGLAGTPVRAGRFSWNSNVNLALVHNKILALDENGADIFGVTGGLETANISRVGQPIGSLYVVRTAGVNPANGNRIFLDKTGRQVQYRHIVAAGEERWTYLDGSKAPAVTLTADGQLYGPTTPTWFGAWDNTFRYGGLDLNVQLQYAGGNYLYNGTKAGLRDQRFWNNEVGVLRRWTKEGQQTDIPRAVLGDNVSNGSAFPISENVEKGDFLRVRNIALGYNLPPGLLSKVRINTLRVYTSVSNAFLFTKYSGTDPEVSTNGNTSLTPGIDRNSLPMQRSFTVGANVGF
jgi:TonB-dependent starch-binding outer membrane protein SusC